LNGWAESVTITRARYVPPAAPAGYEYDADGSDDGAVSGDPSPKSHWYISGPLLASGVPVASPRVT
jgi:hypothetical protein